MVTWCDELLILHICSNYRTQMTLNAEKCGIFDVIGLHRRYWYQTCPKRAAFSGIAALESETLL
ncbi:hypothetical protein, partial [Paenibacillus odorifer]|uniref:hypothetical protein n=1 Tax=Paenibacillus odorifer TaxID=189426 RepID=UPI001C4D85D7